MRYFFLILSALFAQACVLKQQKALAPAERGAREREIKILSDSALALYEQGDCASQKFALALYRQAAARVAAYKARATLAGLFSNMARIHNNFGRADSALVYARKALALGRELQDREIMLQSVNYCAEVFHGLGLLDSAGSYYGQALALMAPSGAGKQQGLVFLNVGAAYHALGRLGAALSYLHRALAVLPVNDDRARGVAFNNLGRVLQTLGRPDSALTYFRESLSYRRKAQDRAGEATTRNNMGYSHDLLNRLDSALIYYRQAYALRQQGCQRSDQALTLINIGRIFLAQDQPDSALSYLLHGLQIKEEAGDHSGQAWALNDLGRSYHELGEHDLALGHYHGALRKLRQVGDRSREGVTWYNLARLFHEAGPGQNLKLAVAYYDSAARLRATVRRQAGADPNRLSFAEQDVRVFEHWALAALALEKDWGQTEARVAALAAVERGRAQALLDFMQSAALAPASRIDLVEEGNRHLQFVRQTGAALLSYLVASDTLLAWFISPSGEIHLKRTAIARDSLANLVHAMRAHMGAEAGGRALPGFERGLRPVTENTQAMVATRTLAQLLLPAAEFFSSLPPASELIIIPHGALGLLPFAALPLAAPENFLGIRYAVRYAPSLALLAAVENKKNNFVDQEQQPRFSEALIVANPAMPAIQNLAGEWIRPEALPGAEQEGLWLEGKLGIRALTGNHASEATVKQRLARASLAHFATHGFAYASEAQARDSYIVLAAGKKEDGLLTVGEIMDEKFTLAAELIALSACQTGLGNLKQAEGIVGLQRAFLAQGSRSVLVSLWNVSDKATQVLMKGFYTHWLDDPDSPGKAEALRRAQEEVRRAGFDHPRYWAAFQLVGAR